MSPSIQARSFPRGPLIGAAALVGLAMASATLARMSGIGATHLPPAAPVVSRDLRFEDRPDGAVTIYAARTATVVDVLPPRSNGFVRGVLRGLARARKREHLGADVPVRLTRWSDGRLSVEDPSTGEAITLEAFGMTNAEAFARLLNLQEATP
jgi:putative photosynthetic complex assembly protein